jgi:predicted ArsR family transcriptional regulator
MSANTREEAKKRTELLASLRDQHRDQVSKSQALLKEQQAARRTLQRAMQVGPQTVPQLAEATGLPAHQVLWHVTAWKKYGLVEEVGMDEDETYYLYRLLKEARA